MDNLIATLSLVFGTILILAQIGLAFRAAKTAMTVEEGIAANVAIPDKWLETVGKLADKAPLLTGGILLYLLAALVSGALDFTAGVATE